MATFRLSLPPTSNHAYKVATRPMSGAEIAARLQRGKRRGLGVRSRMVKTEILEAWEVSAAKVVGAWVPPARTPLAVLIVLELPPTLHRKSDVDGYIKHLVDCTVGRRRDQWVDRLVVVRRRGEGWATVEVSPQEREERV